MNAIGKRLVSTLKELHNAAAARLDVLAGAGEGQTIFRCNVCGRMAKVDKVKLTREEPSCRCGSSVRLRAIIHLLTQGLFCKSLAIRDIPERHDIVGIDMSGAAIYADRLARRLGYTNTYLHREPRLDITAPGAEWLSRCDFVISSDVFEHVASPVFVAFGNVLRLLKPGGLFVLTVPWVMGGETIEHFPELADYRIERRGTDRVLVGRTPDGIIREYRNLVFHGGEGETIEMRVFSKSGILGELARSGFGDIRIHAEPCEEFGILWKQPWSLPITARRPPA
ncbi:MAG: methyltransferase domain-containing protein [Rhodocyclaceae bacterium]|nr:methyltransferase domain-containing protein [Rhodocyclaceae bacterium]MCB1891452.1 methyltransferase domain-containing protein [Rhodocyclaceae bacterium]